MTCHPFNLVQPLGSDNKFHNIGVSAHKQNFVELARKGLAMVNSQNAEAVDRAALETDMSELGRFLVTKQPYDIGGFKTPQLRNLLLTGPYFHDGSQETLWDVIDHYNKGGVQNPFLDGGIQRLGLTENEIDDLVAFLSSLTVEPLSGAGQQGAGAAARTASRQAAAARHRRRARQEGASRPDRAVR